jgi:hypothetical protein
MTRNAITARYLDAAANAGFGATEMPDAASAAEFDLQATTYFGRCLGRPAFVSRDEVAVLEHDLNHLHTALTALPDRLFGGDLAAFARAAGMNDAQVEAVLRIPSKEPTRLARADLYHDGTAFRLMELNIGSTVGGMDNALVNRAAMALPFLSDFVTGNGLAYVDTLAELAALLAAEAGTPPGERTLVIVVDMPDKLHIYESLLMTSSTELGRHGIDFLPVQLADLRIGDGGVWFGERRVDLIYRLFLVEDFLEPGTPALLDPLMSAVERGDVAMYSPLDNELFGSKAALAMLSDEANRHLFPAEELESLDRLLPWTRMVRHEDVTVGGSAGATVDLHEYAVAQREELVLKPAMMHGGLGVVLGWQLDDDQWRKQLEAANDGPYVLQQRIRAVPEPFPTADGVRPMLLIWGAFTLHDGRYGGALVRGTTDLTGSVLNGTGGATLSCCFHEPA